MHVAYMIFFFFEIIYTLLSFFITVLLFLYKTLYGGQKKRSSVFINFAAAAVRDFFIINVYIHGSGSLKITANARVNNRRGPTHRRSSE